MNRFFDIVEEIDGMAGHLGGGDSTKAGFRIPISHNGLLKAHFGNDEES